MMKTAYRNVSSKSFDRLSYAPDERFGSATISALLHKSILNRVPVEEAKARIELAACYRLFGLAGWVSTVGDYNA